MPPYAFHSVTIRDRRDGATFPYTSYTRIPEEAAAFARATFASGVFEVVGGEPPPANDGGARVLASRPQPSDQLSLF